MSVLHVTTAELGHASGFNGGRSQINLNFPGNCEFPFANVCLHGSAWLYTSGANDNGVLSINDLDANGMPTVLSAGIVTANTAIPSSLARPGNYVIRTTGTGTVQADGTSSPLATASFTGVLTSGVLTVSGLTGTIQKGQALVGTGVTAGSCIGIQLSGTTYQISNYLTGVASTQSLASVTMTTSNGSMSVSGTGRHVYYPGDRGVSGVHNVYISSLGSPPISAFAVMHVDDEAAWILDPWAFNPKFKSLLRNGKFGVIRGLNWSRANLSNVTTWATRKPTSYFNFGYDECRTSLNAGTATHTSGTSINISSVAYSSGTGLATIVLASPHGKVGTFKVSMQTRSLGFPTYNGQFTATVVNTTTFTYPLSATPVVPSANGVATFNVYDYAVTFGSGGPVDKQTMHFYFDLMGGADFTNSATLTGTKTCNWSGHTFTGGERVGFTKDAGNSNLPVNVGPGTSYYVLPTNLVAGVSFEFSLTSGGAAVTFTAVGGTTTATRLYTLNLNGSGAVPIRHVSGNPLYPPSSFANAGSQGSVPSPYLQYGQISLATVVYDSHLGAWLIMGGNMSNAFGLMNGVPPEIILKLCEEVGAHSWYCVPALALDPQTDYVAQLYTLARTVAWNIPRFECCNEMWNSIFYYCGYARAKSHVLYNAQFGTSSFDEAQWMGKVNSMMGQTLASLAGSVGNNYWMVCGVKSDQFEFAGGAGETPKFTSTNFIAQSQSAQTLSVPALGFSITFSKAAAYTYGTHAAPANYLAPAGYQTFNPATFAANFAFFTASIAAGVMTVTSMGMGGSGAGTLKIGQTVSDFYGQIPLGVTITGLGTGSGGTGTYNLSNSGFSVISSSMMATNATATAQVDTFLNGMNGSAVIYNNAMVLQYFTNCKNYLLTLPNNAAGVKMGVTAYEGGYSADYHGDAALNSVYAAAKFSPYIGIALCSGGAMADASSINGNYDDLVALGVQFPSAFNLASTGNVWSTLDPDIYATPTNQQYAAIAAFNT